MQWICFILVTEILVINFFRPTSLRPVPPSSGRSGWEIPCQGVTPEPDTGAVATP